MLGRSLDADQARITDRKMLLVTRELQYIDSSERANGTSLRMKMNADAIQLENVKQELLMSRQRQVDLERQMARQQSLVEQG